jgi:YD repeat-containing protein
VTNKRSNGASINSYGYQYDLNGNITQKSDNGATTHYGYDPAGRLDSVTEPDATQTSYKFDKQNNIMTKTVKHPASYSFAFKKDGQDYAISQLLISLLL